MAKNKDRLLHGEHNEEVCRRLALDADYPDWIIITAFYASLHFVSFKIFPFNHRLSDGSSIRIESIEQWQRFKSYTSNKRHELLKELVGRYCTFVYDEYEWLLDNSIAARYYHFQYDKLIAEKAVRLMKEIKKVCLQ